MTSRQPANHNDPGATIRHLIYRHFIRQGRAPSVAEMAAALGWPAPKTRAVLRQLAATHAFVLQENGELWRAAPFSAVPTSFAVRIGSRSWWANCVWDGLGIPAMLHKDARIEASCGCCNHEMVLQVSGGKPVRPQGVIHFAVPAARWYDDIVFT